MAETTPLTGIGAMEAAAAPAIAIAVAERERAAVEAAAADQWDLGVEMTADAIERRNGSPEVALLNDAAELHIYGSRGRTYTNPETGAVIADAAHPIKGKIEEIRENRRYGTTEAERTAAAEAYEWDVNMLLVADELEPAQAAMIMDLREEDNAGKGQMIGRLIASGVDPVEAKNKAETVYRGKDKEHLQAIKDVGLNTREEYDGWRAARNRGPGEGGGAEDALTPPVSPELTAKRAEITALSGELDRATNLYALETARSRNSYLGRFAQSDTRGGRLLRRIPGVRNAIEGLNNRSDQNVVQAREDYERLYSTVGALTAGLMEMEGLTHDQITEWSAVGGIEQDAVFESAVVRHRLDESRDGNRFTDWWVRNDGRMGRVKKAAVVAVAGGAVGAATVLAAPALAVGGIGASAASFVSSGATGAGIARHVNKRRADSNTRSPHEITQTLAGRQSDQDRSTKEQTIRAQYASNIQHQVGQQTRVTERRTDQEMLGNRKRVRQAARVGKAAGTGVGLVTSIARGDLNLSDVNIDPRNLNSGFSNVNLDPRDVNLGLGDVNLDRLRDGLEEAYSDFIPDEIDNPSSSVMDTSTPDEIEGLIPKDVGAPSPDDVIKGEHFYVNPTNGITHEMNDFARLNGFEELDPNEVSKLFEEAGEKFGKDNLINTETYELPTGNPGIQNSGGASWNPDFARFMYERMQAMDEASPVGASRVR